MTMFKIRNIFQKKALVLMYHKISEPETDPWELAVSEKNFEAHLEVLKRKYTVIGIDELAEGLKSKKLHKNVIAITFDDGYLNNFTTARPLLEQYGVPATFFITDSNLTGQQPFWWDELEQIIIHSERLPQRLSLKINSENIEFDLNGESELTDTIKRNHVGFVAYEPPTVRADIYFKLWQLMSPLLKNEQDALLKQIREWPIDKNDDLAIEKCMSLQQLKNLAENNLFTIGAHTKSHPALSYHPKKIQLEEISANKLFLETELNREIKYFAYPSGNFNEETIESLKELRFDAAFTTNPLPAKAKTDVFKINRFQVNNWGKEKFESKLKQWFKL